MGWIVVVVMVMLLLVRTMVAFTPSHRPTTRTPTSDLLLARAGVCDYLVAIYNSLRSWYPVSISILHVYCRFSVSSVVVSRI